MTPRAPALSAGLAVLRELAGATEPLPASVLATRLELPRSSAYHLLGVLIAAGFVVHYPEERGYGLGLGAFEIGTGYLRQERLQRLGNPVLQSLVRRTRATAHLGILLGQELLYLLKQEPRQPVGLVTDVGVRLPAHLTASGRAVLTSLPAAEFAAIYPDSAPLTARPGGGPATIAALRKRIVAERSAGFSEEDGHISPGIGSVSVAVRDRTGRPVAAISVSVRSQVLAERRELLVAETRRAAGLLSRRLG